MGRVIIGRGLPAQKRPHVISVRITNDEEAFLQGLARQDRRSMAALGYFAIQEYIARRKAGAPVTPVMGEEPRS